MTRKLQALLIGSSLMLLAGCTGIQQKYLFYPTHHNANNGLSTWQAEGKTIGYSRQVSNPENVWLMLHGNGGQAADRTYALPSFSEQDSIFILEYPGYGARAGKPSRASFDAAATEAYQLLRKKFPKTPICVAGESIGSGPACALAVQSSPPDKIVLVVPFDNLVSVAGEHVSFLPVSWILEAKWDNTRSLSHYKGLVEIFAAEQDTVIPIYHARKLADRIPSSQFHPIPGGHNDWSRTGLVKIRNPK